VLVKIKREVQKEGQEVPAAKMSLKDMDVDDMIKDPNWA
jgi:hypothetical protein